MQSKDNPSRLWFTCERCGSPFWRYRSDAKNRSPRYCDRVCMLAPRPLLPHPTDQTAMLVPMAGDEFAVIDATDADRVGRYSWSLDRTPWGAYAHASINGKTTRLHRFIVQDAGALEVDHRDRDGLNCRRSNLRRATSSQNGANRPARRQGFKGAYPCQGRWQAKIGGKSIHLGTFDTEEEAARAYDTKAIELYGEFARLNFPDEVAA